MDEDNIEQMEMEQFSKLVVSPKYKIAFCPIPKVLSSILFEAICYLENEEKFKNTKDINHGWYYFGLCTKEGRLTYLTGKAAKEFMDGERGGKDYLKIAIVRNPVDRFLSGYSNKCLRVIDGKLHKGRDCYECNNNMKCILETLHLRSKLYLNGSLNGYIEPKNEVPQIDLHLLPQSWSCDFAHHLNDYKIIKYQTEDSSNVLNELFEIFRSRNVSEKLLEGLRGRIYGKYTDHTTFLSPERIQAKDRLFKSPNMLSLIRKIFHSDFQTFNFDYPSLDNSI